MLSAEQLTEIVSAYKDTKQAAQHQNRRAPRVQHAAKTTIYRLAKQASEAALPVQMRDVSARGCSFTVKEKLARDSNFIIRFSRREGQPISVLCTVMHCRAAGDMFRIGAEFTCLVDLHRANKHAHDSVELDRIKNSILT
jgi:c-di-GMP-binding flagellar brake protein YcgR